MSYTNLLYHLVFGTKDRLPLITRELRPRLHDYLGGMVNGLHGTPLEVNGTADHVHVLTRIRPVISISGFLCKFKSIVGLGAAADAKPVQMAGEVWRLHRKSFPGRARESVHS